MTDDLVAGLAAIERALDAINRGSDEANEHLDRLLALLEEQQQTGPPTADPPTAGLRAVGQRLASIGPRLTSSGNRLATLGAHLVRWADERDQARPAAPDVPPEA